MRIFTRSTHSQRLETWLGPEVVKQISDAMRGYHADIAIPVANVPGRIYCAPMNTLMAQPLNKALL